MWKISQGKTVKVIVKFAHTLKAIGIVSQITLLMGRFVIMALFAGSNGVVATWCMIHGPSQVDQSEKEEMEVAGYVMAFALIFGILIGSVIATIIQQVAYM
mmetsp:Transcript_17973/g.15329  ORF Transcript_17973/g.15329 Transcript_17973/m.15329 type:complete len:101 (+) Transcript_17973:153-455(+)